MTDTSKHTISASATLRDAMTRLNDMGGSPLILFAINEEGVVIGSLTDGDIRRALLRNESREDKEHDEIVSERVSQAVNRRFTALRPGDDAFTLLDNARRRNLRMLPRLDLAGRLVELVDLEKVKSLLPLDAVLMAGGRGERLMPLTADTPKPLLRVGGQAIIDYNVAKLRSAGIDNVYLCLNYLHEQITTHFATHHSDLHTTAIVERKRMGTFGALSLISDWKHDNVLVMNADLLSSLSLEEMYRRHIETNADATMAVAPYSVAVPFAIIETQGDYITGMREKPVYNYFANAGVYIMKRSLVETIPADSYVDAPDFLLSVMSEGKKVSYFPIVGTWIDIGTPEQYARACALVK